MGRNIVTLKWTKSTMRLQIQCAKTIIDKMEATVKAIEDYHHARVGGQEIPPPRGSEGLASQFRETPSTEYQMTTGASTPASSTGAGSHTPKEKAFTQAVKNIQNTVICELAGYPTWRNRLLGILCEEFGGEFFEERANDF